jgi:hypothetical protein
MTYLTTAIVLLENKMNINESNPIYRHKLCENTRISKLKYLEK